MRPAGGPASPGMKRSDSSMPKDFWRPGMVPGTDKTTAHTMKTKTNVRSGAGDKLD